jgi:hypothetical protein
MDVVVFFSLFTLGCLFILWWYRGMRRRTRDVLNRLEGVGAAKVLCEGRSRPGRFPNSLEQVVLALQGDEIVTYVAPTPFGTSEFRCHPSAGAGVVIHCGQVKVLDPSGRALVNLTTKDPSLEAFVTSVRAAGWQVRVE